MKISNLFVLLFGSVVKAEVLSVYTPAVAVPGLPLEGQTSCGGFFEFGDGVYEGGVGLNLHDPAFAIAVNGDGAKMSDQLCKKSYRLSREDEEGEVHFVVVTAFETSTSTELSVGPSLCLALCGEGCEEGGSTCELTVQEVPSTYVYTATEGSIPEEIGAACDSELIDWVSNSQGLDGSDLQHLAYAIKMADGNVQDEVRCFDKYHLVSESEEIWAVIAGTELGLNRNAIAIGSDACSVLCQETCVEASYAPCEIYPTLIERSVFVPVYSAQEDTAPEGMTQCADGAAEWGTAGQGGVGSEEDPAFGILTGETEESKFLNEGCSTVYHLSATTTEAFVVVAAYEGLMSDELSIGADVCELLCGEVCTADDVSPCMIAVTEFEGAATTTEEVETTETTEETSTEAPTRGADEIEIFLWDGSCEEVSCGSVDWDSQTLCGSRLLPCFAKVEGALTVIDETLDSETNGQKIPVECGHLLAIEGRYIHVISIDEESNSNALFIADETFLGLCPFVCKESKVCAVSEVFCGAEGIYTDCSCPDDASDTLCQDCDGECQEVLIGSARGALDNEISVFAEAVIVGEEAVGAAREFGIATGFAAAALILM